MSKISLLIPCFNKEKYLPILFRTLKKQTDKNFNVIFLNDKSTDNTEFMLQEFKKNNNHLFDINIISLKKNSGISRARNLLIESCQTDYFYFLDPDDQLYAHTIQYLNLAIEKENFDLVYGTFSLKYKNIRIFNYFRKKQIKKVNANPISFLKNEQYFIWNKLINKNWYTNQNLHFLNGTIFEDFPVTINLFFRARKIKYLNKNLYIYKINDLGLSRSLNRERISGIAKNLDYLYTELEKTRNI
ncbi:glycosyltransferase family 2 protein [Mesomycoplasma lagogenitalium]|uniref:Glycosyltransferase family 2 protein n=1 Tax=Mesomycoplasma lagogenitalium TaxID=171286 RepID=A0ABY8LTN2_9BACT|nr:glycosyltransferase family 2 protein [Mesomycoplasma lagogenitalium]WGI36604.1 glycosyltransferase family 2 protein [Mesomycoplasma lagogenitalium]